MYAALLHERDDLDGARRYYQAAIDAGGRSFDLFNNLGVVCLDLGNAREAVGQFQAALEQAPGDRVVRMNLAEAKAAAGYVRDAMEIFTALVEEKSDDGSAYLAMAKVLADQGWYADAGNALAMARRFGGESLDLINQEGIVLREQFRYADALERFEAALAVEPANVPLRVSRANMLGWLRRDDEADAAYRQALAMAPNDADAGFSYACFLLMRGRVDPGWRYYEARLGRHDGLRAQRPQTSLPQWQGGASDPDRDSLMVLAEQGFGDNLQFVRLLQRISPLFKRVVLVTRPALLSLLKRSLADVADVVTEVPDPTGFRWQVPLVSIAHALTLPVVYWSMPAPYLWPDPVKAPLWQAYLPADGRKRVGLCWSGGKRLRHRHRFDLPLDVGRRLARSRGCRLGQPPARGLRGLASGAAGEGPLRRSDASGTRLRRYRGARRRPRPRHHHRYGGCPSGRCHGQAGLAAAFQRGRVALAPGSRRHTVVSDNAHLSSGRGRQLVGDGGVRQAGVAGNPPLSAWYQSSR